MIQPVRSTRVRVLPDSFWMESMEICTCGNERTFRELKWPLLHKLEDEVVNRKGWL